MSTWIFKIFSCQTLQIKAKKKVNSYMSFGILTKLNILPLYEYYNILFVIQRPTMIIKTIIDPIFYICLERFDKFISTFIDHNLYLFIIIEKVLIDNFDFHYIFNY